MNNNSFSETFNNHEEYPEVTQKDLDRAKFRVGLKPTPNKQNITILLDTNLIEYFKAKAGENGYQSLINEILKQAKEQEQLHSNLS